MEGNTFLAIARKEFLERPRICAYSEKKKTKERRRPKTICKSEKVVRPIRVDLVSDGDASTDDNNDDDDYDDEDEDVEDDGDDDDNDDGDSST